MTTRTMTMTDLEAHVSADGRGDVVKQVRAQIDRLGIQYIYYQFVSVTGRIVGKGVPADHWESICERGFQLVYGSTANLFVDRHRRYIGYGPEASELVGLPDPETFGEYQLSYRTGDILSPHVTAAEPLSLELTDFCAAIREGSTPRSSAELGLEVVRIIEAVCDSLAADGARVMLTDAPARV